jgi:hypothetical protein
MNYKACMNLLFAVFTVVSIFFEYQTCQFLHTFCDFIRITYFVNCTGKV